MEVEEIVRRYVEEIPLKDIQDIVTLIVLDGIKKNPTLIKDIISELQPNDY